MRGTIPPPIPKIPTLIGWDLFCLLPQRWRCSRAWSRERHPCEVGVSATADASLFSVFPGGHASVLEATPLLARVQRRSVVVGNSCSGGDRVPSGHKKTARRRLLALSA